MKKNKLPRISIAGKPNVGKSALFNKISSDSRALVYDEKGVTRDPVFGKAEWKDYVFEIIDTAGLFSKKSQKNDFILNKASEKAYEYIKSSDAILFVVDAFEGLDFCDYEIYEELKKINKKIIIAANKFDKKNIQENLDEIFSLPHNVVSVSAMHSLGINDLLDEIIEVLKLENLEAYVESGIKSYNVTFLGRPNVGKSSLLNALSNSNRSLVSEVPGTTRESIKEEFEFDDITLNVIDTAGVRKQSAVEGRLESLMVSNTISMVEKSHLVLVVFDLSERELFDQDIKLLGYIFQDLCRSVIVIWNKIDLLENEDYKKIVADITEKYKHIFENIPAVFISTKTKENIDFVFPLVKRIIKNYHKRFIPEEILNIFRNAFGEKNIKRCCQPLKILDVNVLRTAPPTFLIKTSNARWFNSSHRAILSKVLRKKFDLEGVPIKLLIK